MRSYSKLFTHILKNLKLALSNQVVIFGFAQKEDLFEIASEFIVDYVCLFEDF